MEAVAVRCSLTSTCICCWSPHFRPDYTHRICNPTSCWINSRIVLISQLTNGVERSTNHVSHVFENQLCRNTFVLSRWSSIVQKTSTHSRPSFQVFPGRELIICVNSFLFSYFSAVQYSYFINTLTFKKFGGMTPSPNDVYALADQFKPWIGFAWTIEKAAPARPPFWKKIWKCAAIWTIPVNSAAPPIPDFWIHHGSIPSQSPIGGMNHVYTAPVRIRYPAWTYRDVLVRSQWCSTVHWTMCKS